MTRAVETSEAESSLVLKVPALEDKEAALLFREEFFDNGEPVINGSALFDQTESYEEWLGILERNSRQETVPEGWAVSSTFFVVDESLYQAGESVDYIVGFLDIRHELSTPHLKRYFGNIGYCLRPAVRKRGLAKQVLGLGVLFARDELGLSQLMMGCYQDNVASWKTMERCGAVRSHEDTYLDGRKMYIYTVSFEDRSAQE